MFWNKTYYGFELSRLLIVSSLLSCINLHRSHSQNLIPDPGFENYFSCPGNFTLTANPPQPLTLGWYIPTLGTSDYFNTCAVGTPVHVPGNFFGTQPAFEGDGYAGIFVFSNYNVNYREYLSSALTTALVAGQTYDVGFYVSLSDSSDMYIKELGAFLADVAIGGNFTTNIGVVPQVKNNTGFLSDKNVWVLVEGSYTAVGGENIITIGNFSPDAALDFSLFPFLSNDAVSYYYIDSAYVSPCLPFAAGLDNSLSVCANTTPVDLSQYLTGADLNGAWYDPSGNAHNGLLIPSQSISGIYYYIGGHGSCADTAEVAVTIVPVKNAGMDGSVNICAETDLFSLLTGTPDQGGTWYDPGGFQFTNPFSPSSDSAGIYSYVVGSNGCGDTAFLDVTVNEPVHASLSVSAHAGCSPLMVSFEPLITMGNIENAFWNFGDGDLDSSMNTIHQYIDSGCYEVELAITTNGGCIDDTVMTDLICVFPNAIADFTYLPQDLSLDNPIVNFINLCTNTDDYLWRFGTIATSDEKDVEFHFPQVAGEYLICLVATNNFGCADSLCRMISFEYGPEQLAIPNAFTPNGDGVNDEFMIYAKWIDKMTLKVFNRWGNQVFETTDFNDGWDGTFKGKPENSGVYVYEADIYFLTGIHMNRKGAVTLLR